MTSTRNQSRQRIGRNGKVILALLLLALLVPAMGRSAAAQVQAPPPTTIPSLPPPNYVYAGEIGEPIDDSLALLYPYAVAVSDDGYVYIGESGTDRVQKYTTDGVFVDTWGEFGQGDGQFDNPFDIAVDDITGRVYVADTNNNRVQIFESDGTRVTEFGYWGEDPGDFKGPTGVAVSETGFIYVVDSGNHRVQVFDTYLQPDFEIGLTNQWDRRRERATVSSPARAISRSAPAATST